MGREVRRVPPDWEHPRDSNTGHHIPLYGSFPYTEEEVREGLRDGWLDDTPPRVMPEWPESAKTHFQMYETCSEGTPISPPLPSPEALARWLSDNGASTFGYLTATYDQWLAMIRQGSAVSAVISDGRIQSGVEFFGNQESKA